MLNQLQEIFIEDIKNVYLKYGYNIEIYLDKIGNNINISGELSHITYCFKFSECINIKNGKKYKRLTSIKYNKNILHELLTPFRNNDFLSSISIGYSGISVKFKNDVAKEIRKYKIFKLKEKLLYEKNKV